MKGVLWSIFLTVACVNCVLGSSSISSFIIKTWNTRTRSWDKDAKINPREDVRLECTTTEFSQVNELNITRANGFSLSKNHTMDIQKDTQSLVVILKSVECSQMGTYVCENGLEDKKTVDLGIYYCPPRPCKDQSTNITLLYVSVNKATQFSVCVEAFPNVSSLFFFNGIEVRFNRTSEFSVVHCTLNKLKEVFGTYNISCTIIVTSGMNYTVHNFSIPSGMAPNQRVSFAVQIEKPGPPDCPTGIISTNQGRGYVTLSWQPVNNRGGSQPVNYTIFYTTVDTEWQRSSTVEDTHVTINRLQFDTDYGFRVVSANEYSQVIDENTCRSTIAVKTAFTITSTTTTTTSSPVFTNEKRVEEDSEKQDAKNCLCPIVIVVIVLATIVVVAGVVVLVVCLKIRRFNFQSQTRTPPSRTNMNGCHTQEPAQQILLMDNTSRNGHRPRFQNVVIDEPVYESVT